MITRIEVTRYRCFEKLDVELSGFDILVGANGSGKTTLLDIPALFGDLLRSRTVAMAFLEARGEHQAPRASSLKELIFQGKEGSFILAIEARLPELVTRNLLDTAPKGVRESREWWPGHIRYEIRLEYFNNDLQVESEYLYSFSEKDAPTRRTLNKEAPRLHAEVQPRPRWRWALKRSKGSEPEFTLEVASRR
jgi:predicted ATPase